MDDLPFGMIEIVLAFGALLALALWELRRNNRQLKRMAKERDRTHV